jgi:flagellar biosynthetic protein FliP
VEAVVTPLFALGAVLAVLFGLRALVARAARTSRVTSLRVAATCALGPKQRLHVVEVAGERLLIGATDQNLRLLRRLPPSPPLVEATRDCDARDASPRLATVAARLAPLVAFALLGLLAPAVSAQGLDPGAWLEQADLATRPERLSTTLEVLFVLTVVSVAPSILLMATCFTRVVIVLALLRQALGVQQLPPNQVLVGLALAITLFVMAPLGAEIKEQALDPYLARSLEASVAAERAADELRGFMLQFTREKDLALFVSLSKVAPVEGPADVPLLTLLPAYMISELRTAFEIGFSIFLPFLVIDLVIASMLISMQMIVLPPVLISLPFKLVLFVLVDGWNLTVTSLVRGLAGGGGT